MINDEVIEFCNEQHVKFIRLAFLDIFGKQKNLSILPSELSRAFMHGIAFDASAIDGFESVEHSDLFLFPDPNTLCILPWRSIDGIVGDCHIGPCRKEDAKSFGDDGLCPIAGIESLIVLNLTAYVRSLSPFFFS